MNYWHIQMHLPAGRDKKTLINSKEMLEETNPVIGTGEWDSIQCRHFKGEEDGLQIGSIIMVRVGKVPLALCKVTSDYFRSNTLEARYINKLFRHVQILDWDNPMPTGSLFSQGTLNVLYEKNDTASWNYLNDWHKKTINKMESIEAIKVLKYKKQIILQGPPGTGKTRLAKEIAVDLIKPKIWSEDFVESNLVVGQEFKTPTDYNTFSIVEVSMSKKFVKVKPANTLNEYNITFDLIKRCYDGKGWNDPISNWNTNGNSSYLIPVCKFVFEKANDIETSEYFKLVQFHPSYTYEDFVRGIVSKANNNGTGIIYEAENKTIAKFADAANQNWKASNTPSVVSQENWLQDTVDDFIEFLIEKITVDVKSVILTDKVYLNSVTDKGFRFNSEWEIDGGVPILDLIKMYNAKVSTRKEIQALPTLTKTAKHHSTYWLKILELFKKFIQDKNLKPPSTSTPETERNYILIIDEINRANLSSVLGELIYALEYRGESVDSMYEVKGSNKLILPENLYIIGTMNTADRSVGHIDYAMRRRFAFIDVLPKTLKSDFETELFKQVSLLFVTDPNINPLIPSKYLSAEFRPKDVWLGHSYFIKKKSVDSQIILQYEIVPILEEYIKDGVFKDSKELRDAIENLKSSITS